MISFKSSKVLIRKPWGGRYGSRATGIIDVTFFLRCCFRHASPACVKFKTEWVIRPYPCRLLEVEK
jgi:hypothetical protein